MNISFYVPFRYGGLHQLQIGHVFKSFSHHGWTILSVRFLFSVDIFAATLQLKAELNDTMRSQMSSKAEQLISSVHY